MKKLLIFISALLSLNASAFAQKNIKFGLEQDILPYIFGGYFVGGFVSADHYRIRAVYANVTKPDFILESGFTNNKIEASAILLDYFLSPDQKGIWLGSGLVIWNGSVQTKNQIGTAYHRDYLISIGGGYNYFFTDNLYVSPWCAVHTKVGGSKNAVVNDKTFSTPLFNPEGSLKFGWIF